MCICLIKSDLILYLCYQVKKLLNKQEGLPLRGDKDEKGSNFYQLLALCGEDVDGIKLFMEKKHFKYTSHEIQNEILLLMALEILRFIASNLKKSCYCIMVDETTDAGNEEQVVLVFRWLDANLTVHEEFVGLYKTDSIDAKSLLAIIKDVLVQLGLSIENCHGQCYDGASTMSGLKSGVAKMITDEEPHAVFTHCYGHALNLAVGDTVKQCSIIKSALDMVCQISRLIKNSPKRDASFQRLKESMAPDTPGFRVLCPTRWTVRAASLQSVLDNYQVLLGVWDEAWERGHMDSDLRARLHGVQAQMQTFEFLFGVSLGSLILRHSDNLSKALQNESMSAAEGQELVKLTLDVLQSLRNQDHFHLFYQGVVKLQAELSISSPLLPRKRHAIGVSVEDHYRHLYYEAIDLVIMSINNRFDQPGYNIYKNLQNLILKACSGRSYTNELDFVCSFYKDLNKQQLQTQLPLIRALVVREKPDMTISGIVKVLSELSEPQRVGFRSIWALLELLLVMPATNATSERSFSALRRLKTYLRTTMSQLQLNNLMVLHVYKELTDSLDLKSIACSFVNANNSRKRIFGQL